MSERARQELWATLCLKHAPGLGPRSLKKILERYANPVKALERVRGWQDAGLATSQQVQAFLAESWRPHAEKELSGSEELGLNTLLWSDERYSVRLREIPDPPVLLYYEGDLGLLANPGVAVVGSRDCSRYGIELAHRISMDLSDQGLTVI